jgi:hypothetical protein
MSDPEIKDLSPQLSNVQNSLYSVIENSKQQQWTITNYVILVYAAIFGLSRLMMTSSELSPNELRVFTDLILLACLYSTGLLLKIQWDLKRYREQLAEFHTRTISELDREKYKIKVHEYPLFVGGWFLGALLGVVLIGAVLVIYSLWRMP